MYFLYKAWRYPNSARTLRIGSYNLVPDTDDIDGHVEDMRLRRIDASKISALVETLKLKQQAIAFALGYLGHSKPFSHTHYTPLHFKKR